MPNVDFTLEDLKRVFVTKEDAITRDDMHGVALAAMANEHRTLAKMVREEIVGEREYTRQMMHQVTSQAKIEIIDELGHVRDMLSEDIMAVSGRLDKVDRRSAATQSLLKKHMADSTAHRRTTA